MLNMERENGYVVGTIDNINNGGDAQYWTDSFLHVTDCDDDYHQTVKLMEMCNGFVKQQDGISDIDRAVAAKRTADAFAAGDSI